MSGDAGSVPGTIIEDTIIEARGRHACKIKTNKIYHIINIKKKQITNFLYFNLTQLKKKLSPHNTLLLNNQIFPHINYTLYSNKTNKQITITTNTNNTHNIITNTYSHFTNKLHYNIKNTPNYHNNFTTTLTP